MREMLNSKESWFRSSKTKVLMPEAHAFCKKLLFVKYITFVRRYFTPTHQETRHHHIAINSFIALDYIEKMSKFLRASVTYSGRFLLSCELKCMHVVYAFPQFSQSSQSSSGSPSLVRHQIRTR